ncbi:protein-glutamate O-methyltransferase CheR [Geobacter sp. DSM 9736]|uniref:CheR family methyltransferase n=1 Tax=Geobacter sp. DSM 9736 TaxID=1277350 RepID=UPI001E2A2283|nr:protein-glutamate O-methyltransferase CheR [Geobacter sp. DSM 9736]
MTDEEFRLIRDVIHDHSGLFFDFDFKYLLEKRLSKRLISLQLNNFTEYYRFLKYGRTREQELSDTMDILTTNETYFFREAFQLKAFTEEILPDVRSRKEKKGDRSLRIWSAGCSTGEEPYTIAILLLEMGCFDNWRIEVIGTDISNRVLQHARKGIYGRYSFRTTEGRYIDRYFTKGEDSNFEVCDKVKGLVTISHLNLVDHSRLALLGTMDVVFCRNVIIYFDIESKKKVIDSFYKALSPNGYLLLGHSESLMNITTSFALKHLQNDLVYQKPETRGGVCR